MYKSKKKLVLIFLLVIFDIIFVMFLFKKNNNNLIFYDSNKYYELVNRYSNEKQENLNIISYINLNNNKCSYDKKSDSFLCFLDEKYPINFKIESPLNYSIISNSSFNINNSETYNIFMYTDKYYYNINIKFTDLPIMAINSLPNLNNNNEIKLEKNYNDNELESENLLNPWNSYISLIENSQKTTYSASELRLRGHDSLIYEKKAYKLSLKKYINGNYENNDINLLDMYKDDDWVLDAMYVDDSKIRNKLSSDIWRLISNEKILNGKYLELFINDEYKGLYLLKEYVNKKSLDITEEGSILKAVLYLNKDDTNINYISDKYFLQKYPEQHSKSSNYLLDTLDTYYNHIYSNNDISDFIIENYDLENFLNYKIFIAIIKGVDNNEYNNYYISTKNEQSKIVKTPWDMDLTFGLTFNRTNDFENYNDMGFNIYYENSPYINNLIKQKYWDLRKNKISYDTLNNLIEEYKKQIVESGAANRNSECWNVETVDNEIERIKTWIYHRLVFLDEYFK